MLDIEVDIGGPLNVVKALLDCRDDYFNVLSEHK